MKPTEDAKKKFKALAGSFIELMGIKKGSRIKITHIVEPYYKGWNATWSDRMDALVGKEFDVSYISDANDIVIYDKMAGDYWHLPFLVVEVLDKNIIVPVSFKISKDYDVVFRKDAGIEVGCQTIPFDVLTKVYEAAKSVNNQL